MIKTYNQKNTVINAKELYDILDDWKEKSSADSGLKEPACLERVQKVVAEMAESEQDYKQKQINYKVAVEKGYKVLELGFESIGREMIDFMNAVSERFMGDENELKFIVYRYNPDNENEGEYECF